MKIIAEVAVELDIVDKMVLGASIGCATFPIPGYHKFSMFGNLHGRAPASATGFKRRSPDTPVLLIQGDGDCAAIGTAESVHAASRGEAITVIMVNNQIYGMTGGQMAPTTLIGQKTATTRYGRNVNVSGNPIKMAELIAGLDGPVYVTRQSLHTPKNILAAKKSLKKALELQINKGKYSFIELLSSCPTNWRIESSEVPKYMEEMVLPQFPIGVFKDLEV
jgi:2-oxoglutarate ferredoxin oxidoreductase subunit beta